MAHSALGVAHQLELGLARMPRVEHLGEHLAAQLGIRQAVAFVAVRRDVVGHERPDHAGLARLGEALALVRRRLFRRVFDAVAVEVVHVAPVGGRAMAAFARRAGSDLRFRAWRALRLGVVAEHAARVLPHAGAAAGGVENRLGFFLPVHGLEGLEVLGLLPDLDLGLMALLAFAVALGIGRGHGRAAGNCERQKGERERSSRHVLPPNPCVEQRIVLVAGNSSRFVRVRQQGLRAKRFSSVRVEPCADCQ